MDKFKRGIVKISMFISSYFPLYIMLIILHYEKLNEISKLLRKKQMFFCLTIAVCIVISVVSVVFLKLSCGNTPLRINEIERPDDTVISYMMTYIIPIMTTNFLNNGEVVVNIILFLLIGYLYIRLNLLYLNPLWSMFGYLSYRANSDVIIITNIKFSEIKVKQRNNINLRGVYLANDIFLALRKNN